MVTNTATVAHDAYTVKNTHDTCNNKVKSIKSNQI